VPWVSYLAFDGMDCVDICGFKTAPKEGSVEIGYGTVKRCEGRGYATEMASRLIELARKAEPDLTITAQTLPEKNASNSVLRKLGFSWVGPVEHPEDGTVWEWRQTRAPVLQARASAAVETGEAGARFGSDCGSE
jgi:[ribosomal protein S5]-alanine N-acetyltransferase